ncbi:MAG: hypothetical protein HOM58_00055 [Rhodospirillaceae bacterium]|jgi:hypothetical protein|nr:hypothetical protein [Rhodospirillaceae bacterium]MBT5455388.1 hypothetical protein [Rhodospirillaceae bacterium]
MTMTIRFCLALCLTLIVAASWRTEASAQSAPVFLKAFYPLDEPRFHCVDIPGHKAKVNVTRPLSVHTCKEGIWHKDELFDPAALKKGHLRMPEYGLCVEATEASEGAELILKACGSSALQIWQHKNYRLVLMAHPDTCLTIGPEPSRLTRGGQRLPSKHMARSLMLAACSESAFARQLWRLEAPQNRSGAVMPFGK